jgi:hypothetical protein
MDYILDKILYLNEKKKQNYNNSDSLNILSFYFGKKINDEIFNSSKKNKDILDIIPLINSLFHCDIKEFNYSKNKNIYFKEDIYNIKYINNKKTTSLYNKFVLEHEIQELPFENNENDLLIKEYIVYNKKNYLFNCDLTYNYKEYYLELEWIFYYNIKLIVKIFKNSYSFHIETKDILFSKNDIKKIKIFLSNIEKILFIY